MKTDVKIRSILHCDLNNFYASVECANDPYLADKYVAVCGNPEMRHGIVLAKNTKAKQMGVKTGEAIWQAQQKCPELIVVRPTFGAYSFYSKAVQSIYYRYTDLVESMGLDECWLDVSHSAVLGDGEAIANELREVIKRETGLTISVGVSFNKVFAKLGSDIKKPDATTVIPYESFPEVIYSLPASDMLMVGSKTGAALKKLNICTIGDLAYAPTEVLTKHFGINGKKMQDFARGLDDSPVSPVNTHDEIKSVGHGFTSSVDIESYEQAHSLLLRLCEMVCSRMRSYNLAGKTLTLHIRYNDLTGESHQTSLPQTNLSEVMYKETLVLLHRYWNPLNCKAVRTFTVSLSSLSSATTLQNSIFFPNLVKAEKIEQTVDAIRNKYGYDAIIKAQNLYKSLPSPVTSSAMIDHIPFQSGGITIEDN
ncbi:MAG: DNA polymerase IV [Clostridia bacterium]|nr:DNA polymerase IV [Clostridia bacterium]